MNARNSVGWAREMGIAAGIHMAYAAAGNDRRIAHEYHEERAVRFARRAAHYAFLADPSLRSEDVA